MDYGIYFEYEVPTERLRQALHTAYGIPGRAVAVGSLEQVAAAGGPRPMVLVSPTGAGAATYGWELSAGQDFAEATGASPIQVAATLSSALGVRILVDDGTDDPERWILITPEGGQDPVRIDPAADTLTILNADVPISGAPEIPAHSAPDASARPEHRPHGESAT